MPSTIHISCKLKLAQFGNQVDIQLWTFFWGTGRGWGTQGADTNNWLEDLEILSISEPMCWLWGHHHFPDMFVSVAALDEWYSIVWWLLRTTYLRGKWETAEDGGGKKGVRNPHVNLYAVWNHMMVKIRVIRKTNTLRPLTTRSSRLCSHSHCSIISTKFHLQI